MTNELPNLTALAVEAAYGATDDGYMARAQVLATAAVAQAINRLADVVEEQTKIGGALDVGRAIERAARGSRGREIA